MERIEERRARMRLAMKRWIAKPGNREKNRLRMVALRMDPAKREADRLYARNRRANPAHRDSINQYAREFRASQRGKFNNYQGNARARSLCFQISFEQFQTFWQKPCRYCGDPIKTIGLDRVDNAIGYTMTNVAPCCAICNHMKLKRDLNFFIEHCLKIAIFSGRILK